MAGQLLSSMLIEIAADLAKFESDLGRAHRIAQKQSDRIRRDLEKIGKAVGAALGTGFAALAKTVEATAGKMDRLAKASQSINLPTEKLSALGYAAEQSGSSLDTITQAFARLSKNALEAASGNAEMQRAFKALGVEVKDASGNVRDADKVFLDLATRFANMENGTAKTALAIQLFGRSAGPELVPLLNQGASGIEDLMNRAKELGAVVGSETAAQAEYFNDRIDDIRTLMQGWANDITAQLLPSLASLSKVLVDEGAAARKAGEGNSLLADAFKLLLQAGAGVAALFEIVGRTLGSLAGLVVDVVPRMMDLLSTFAETAYLALTNPAKLGQLAAVAKQNAEAAVNGIKGALATFADSVEQDWSEAAKKLKSRINAIRNPLDGLANDMGKAGGAAQGFAVDLDALSGEAEKAGKKLADLKQKARQLLDDALGQRFRESLRPTYQAMQEFDAITGKVTSTLVQDIPVIVDGMENLRQSAATMSTVMTEEARAFQENWAGAVEAATDAFANFIAGNIRSFKDFGRALESIARQFLANLVKQFLSTRLVVGGGGIGIAGTASAAGTAGAAAGGSLLGGTFGALLSGAGTAAGLFGLSGLGTGLTASASIFSGAGLVGGFTGSISAGLASIAGGSIMQGIGLLAGPVGIVVGALALLSRALRDTTRRITVIGNDLVGTPGYRNLAPGSTYRSALGGFTLASIDRVSREERDRIGQAVVDFDNAIAKMLNGEQLQRVTDALAQFNLRLEEGAITAENILGARFNAILSTFDQSTQDFVNAADTLEERIKRLAEALERPMRIQAVLDALAEEDMLANMSEAERQIYAINKRFDELRAQLEEWGASEEQLTRLEEYRTAALDRAAAALNNATRAEEERIAALNALMEDIDWDLATHGLSDYEVAVMRVNRAVDQALARAMDLGASEEQLARIRQWGQNQLDDLAAREAERAQAEMSRYWEQVQREQERAAEEQIRALQRLRDQAMSLQAWLTGQSLSETSTLNPLQRLQVAQTDFANVISRALTGPVADIDTGTVTRAADEFLRQALSFYGPGGQYAAVEQAVRAQIAQLMLRMGLAPSAGFNVAAAMGAAGNVAANAPASGIAPAPVPFNTDATLRDVRDAIVQQGSRVVDAVRQMAYSSRQA